MLSPPRTDPAARQVRFEAVYAANHMAILGYALRRTASPDDAADILAETFLTAWRRLDELPSGDEALRALPEQDRELLTLAAWEGLGHGQIAVVLGCSRNAVRIRLHRARQKLAKELNHHPERWPVSPLPPALPSQCVAGDSAHSHQKRRG